MPADEGELLGGVAGVGDPLPLIQHLGVAEACIAIPNLAVLFSEDFARPADEFKVEVVIECHSVFLSF